MVSPRRRSNEAQIPVRGSVCAILRVQEHLQHGDKIPDSYGPEFASLFRLWTATAEVGRLGNVQHASTNALARTADHKIWLYRQRETSDDQRRVLVGRRRAQRQSAQAKGVFCVWSNVIISAQRLASSRLFGVPGPKSALVCNVALTPSSTSFGRLGSQRYARIARTASWFAVTMDVRVKRELCKMPSCLSASWIRYFASAIADIRGSDRSLTAG